MNNITQKKQRRINTDEAILNAARVEIGNCGYTNAKLSDIAKRANISIGLIGQNFGSKEEMLHTLVKREIERTSSQFATDKETDWRKRITLFYDFLLMLFLDNSDDGKTTLRFFYSLLNGYDIPQNSFEVIMDSMKNKRLLDALAEGQAIGELKSGDGIRLLGLFFKTCVMVFFHCAVFNIEPPKKEWFFDVIKK